MRGPGTATGWRELGPAWRWLVSGLGSVGNVAAASPAGRVGLFVLADDTDVLLWPGLGDVAVHASRMALRERHGSWTWDVGPLDGVPWMAECFVLLFYGF